MLYQNDQLEADLAENTLILTKNSDISKTILTLLEQSREATKSDLVCFYKEDAKNSKNSCFKLIIKKGEYKIPNYIDDSNGLISFIKECREPVVILENNENPFFEILLNPVMKSGIALPIFAGNKLAGVMIINSVFNNFYNKSKLILLEYFNKLANNILNNLLIYKIKKKL
jgi:transcriptional regulator with GAF, ATPase, and Fis domain